MLKPYVSYVLLILMSLHVQVRAAQYQFTLEGTVTNSIFSNIGVGDSFTIEYTADSADLNPNPSIGNYSVTSRAVVTLPQVTLRSGPPDLFIGLNEPDRRDQLLYTSDTVQGMFDIVINFPAGTLPSDALPSGLPLDKATLAHWQYGGDFIPFVIGELTSYRGVELPEPAFALVPLALTVATLRVRRRSERS